MPDAAVQMTSIEELHPLSLGPSPEPNFLPLSPHASPLSIRHVGSYPMPAIALPPSSITVDMIVSNKHHGFPYWRLQLTLFAIEETITVKSNTTLMTMRFYDPHEANVAAIDLAQRCRGEGETIMLMNERDLGEHCQLKDEIIVGQWARCGAISQDSVFLLHEVQGYMARRAKGKVTARVQLIEFHDSKDGR